MKVTQTRGTRLAEDLVTKLGWIVRLNPEADSVADVLDPLVRPEIERLYRLIEDRVEQIKTIESQPLRD